MLTPTELGSLSSGLPSLTLACTTCFKYYKECGIQVASLASLATATVGVASLASHRTCMTCVRLSRVMNLIKKVKTLDWGTEMTL